MLLKRYFLRGVWNQSHYLITTVSFTRKMNNSLSLMRIILTSA